MIYFTYINKAKFISPIFFLAMAVVLLVFFGLNQVKAINISDSWMQIGILDLVGIFAILKLLTPPALTSVGAGFFVVLNNMAERIFILLKSVDKIKKSYIENVRFLSVDLAGFAPASSGANADMLLHTPQAQIHESIIKQKEPLFKRFFLQHPTLAHSVTN